MRIPGLTVGQPWVLWGLCLVPVLFVFLIIITYIPQIALFLPNLLF